VDLHLSGTAALVNAASRGIGPPRRRAAFELLLLNVIRMAKASLSPLRASGHGRVMNIASTSVNQATPRYILDSAAYGTGQTIAVNGSQVRGLF
jgi:NAD(P)-dependent dehydrogenase (short-subunit alcohol dehydrogenase family)